MEFRSSYDSVPSYGFSGGTTAPINGNSNQQPGSSGHEYGKPGRKIKPSLKLSRQDGAAWRLNPIASMDPSFPQMSNFSFGSMGHGLNGHYRHQEAFPMFGNPPTSTSAAYGGMFNSPRWGSSPYDGLSHVQKSSGSSGKGLKVTPTKPKARKSSQHSTERSTGNQHQQSMPPPVVEPGHGKKAGKVSKKHLSKDSPKTKVKLSGKVESVEKNMSQRWKAVEDAHHNRLIDLISLKPGEEAVYEQNINEEGKASSFDSGFRGAKSGSQSKAKRLSSLRPDSDQSDEASGNQRVKVVAKVRTNPPAEDRYRKPMAGNADVELFENYYSAKKRIITALKRARPLAILRKERARAKPALDLRKEKPSKSRSNVSESIQLPAADWGHAAFQSPGKRKMRDESPDMQGSFASIGSYTPSHAGSDMSSDPEADESRRKILAQLQKLNNKRARLEAQLTKIQKSSGDDRSGEAHSRSSSVLTGVSGREAVTPLYTVPPRPVKDRRDLWNDQWRVISQVFVPLCHRLFIIRRGDVAANRAKVCAGILREHVDNRMESEKLAAEHKQRARFMVRDMFARWKVIDKEDKKWKKLREKEEVEQKRIALEMQEAKRQQRKLNFLITQTELYSHFMGKKISGSDTETETTPIDSNILKRLEETTEPTTNPFLLEEEPDMTDKLVGDQAKQSVLKAVEDAYNENQKRISKFAVESGEPKLPEPGKVDGGVILTEPKMFLGSLKAYQKKGISWLASLFSNGINGILADEMGLGKTVQSIAFLGHLAEEHGIWGPFLIVAPASTLHNWQQEFSRFLPAFKTVPYWGTTEERKVLRQFWKVDKMHTEHASFHVVITSYQLVVQDASYLKKIKWQYMILDEAQAIKSSTSIRWKMLLDFPCRNRLLLTGTPIQNSMAELWALLHFIMPSLFDSHNEFNEWFSKDIESHAENKSQIDEKHLSRLHMILKPFMMRRIKKDVEEELTDKIEIMVHCPLTRRQKSLYEALKRKISIDDLLSTTLSSSAQSEATSSALMNLVMQFRKVCNHPELFERRDIRSPVFQSGLEIRVPRLVYEDLMRETRVDSKRNLINKYFLLSARRNVPPTESDSLLKFCDAHPVQHKDLERIFCGDTFHQLRLWNRLNGSEERLASHRSSGSEIVARTDRLSMRHDFPWAMDTAKNFLGIDYDARRYSYGTCKVHYVVEDKDKKEKKAVVEQEEFSAEESQEPEVEEPRQPKVVDPYPLYLPHFLETVVPKILARPSSIYSYDRHAESVRTEKALGRSNVAKARTFWYGSTELAEKTRQNWRYLRPEKIGGILGSKPPGGWFPLEIPDKQHLAVDSGKLRVLDSLLHRLKDEGHRVLIYSLMTKMMDILEEFMIHKRYPYMRLDGSSKISDRRDMVKNFQTRDDIFVFLLSTRAGGLGINLTAADTVIFYDSDWNPTVDQQAMDRAHRLGQTKQVTVYRLICRNTVEERILERAQEKSEIQRMVISGGDYRPDTLKPTEVMSLLLDDEEIERRLKLKESELKSEELGSRKQTKKAAPKAKASKKTAGDAEATSSTPKLKGGKKKSTAANADNGGSVPGTPLQTPSRAHSVTPAPATATQLVGGLPSTGITLPEPAIAQSQQNLPVTSGKKRKREPLTVSDETVTTKIAKKKGVPKAMQPGAPEINGMGGLGGASLNGITQPVSGVASEVGKKKGKTKKGS